MAIRGETIGRAYVRILADGSGFDESVRQELREPSPAMRQAGAERNKEFRKGWAEEAKKANLNDDVIDNLHRGIGKLNFEGGTSARAWMAGMRQELDDNFGDDIGAVIGRKLTDAFERGRIDIPGIRHQIENNLRTLIADALDTITDEQDRAFQELHADALRDNAAFNRAWREQNEENEREWSLHIARLRAAAQSMDDMHAEALRDNADFNLRWRRQNEDNERDYQTHINHLRRSLRDSEDDHKRWSTRIGKMFGAGSRNNFINLIGRVVGGLVRLGESLIENVQAFGTWASRVGEEMSLAFTKAGGGFSGLIAGAETLGGELLAMGPVGIAAAIAGLLALSFTLGVVTAAASMLLGAIFALIDSIAIGLVGALAPLVGLLGPIAVAGGAVAAAFIGMDDAAKKATKEALEPLKNELKELGDVARPGILDGLKIAAKNLKGPIEQMKPLFEAAGDGVATFIGAFTDAATGGGFDIFVKNLTKTMPDAMDKLGGAVGNAVDAMLGSLGVLNQPGGVVQQFLDKLVSVTEKFDKFVSREGAKPGGGKIGAFFDGASDSAGHLWDLLSNIWDLVVLLTTHGGKETGDSFLQGLADSVARFIDYLNKNPDTVDKWFRDVKDFGDQLGKFTEAALKLFDELDSPTNRRAAIHIFELMTTTIDMTTYSIEKMTDAVGLMFDPFRQFRIVYNSIIGPTLSFMIDKIGDVEDKLGDMFAAFGNVPGMGWAKDVADDLHEAADEAHDLAVKIKEIPESKTFDFTWRTHRVGPPPPAGVTPDSGFGPVNASGGIYSGLSRVIVGEAGPEAIVPLNRPLSRVDPAVRALSAIAQGLKPMASGGIVGGGRTVNAEGWTIVSNAEDPRAVAHEVLNTLVGASYL